MFKDLEFFNDLVTYWREHNTTVICATATPQQTDDPSENAILTKWWGFNRIQFEEETIAESEVTVNCDEIDWTDEEQKAFVIDAAKKNPVLVCKNRDRFDQWVVKDADQFRYASALDFKDMRRLEKQKC